MVAPEGRALGEGISERGDTPNGLDAGDGSFARGIAAGGSMVAAETSGVGVETGGSRPGGGTEAVGADRVSRAGMLAVFGLKSLSFTNKNPVARDAKKPATSRSIRTLFTELGPQG